MKRRKFGVYFEKDFVFLQYLIERYEIKYSDIEKIVYIKNSFRNNLIIRDGYSSFAPGKLNFFVKTSNKNKLKHFPFLFKYKNLYKIPHKLKSKLLVIERLNSIFGISDYYELSEISRKL